MDILTISGLIVGCIVLCVAELIKENDTVVQAFFSLALLFWCITLFRMLPDLIKAIY